MKRHHIHLSNSLVLLLILLGGAAAFFWFQGNKQAQMVIATLLGAFYALWGMIHHALTKDLYPKVVVEYLLVSIIGVTLMLMVLG